MGNTVSSSITKEQKKFIEDNKISPSRIMRDAIIMRMKSDPQFVKNKIAEAEAEIGKWKVIEEELKKSIGTKEEFLDRLCRSVFAGKYGSNRGEDQVRAWAEGREDELRNFDMNVNEFVKYAMEWKKKQIQEKLSPRREGYI